MNIRADKLSVMSGKAGAVATVVLLLFLILDVFLRFGFSKSYNWLTELEWHVFGLIFLLGGCYNVWADQHVRVDFFYGNFPEKIKSLINLVLHIFFLLSWSAVGFITCLKYAGNSFYIKEASANPGGLPALYPIKYVVVLCFFLVFLQGLTEIYKEAGSLREKWRS
jgi:TRAP-type mannitol/chloroaromatic compound transport system permease small subunit